MLCESGFCLSEGVPGSSMHHMYPGVYSYATRETSRKTEPNFRLNVAAKVEIGTLWMRG